jgi:hypothetical protein
MLWYWLRPRGAVHSGTCMEFDIEWDADRGVATITHRHLVLDCKATVVRWRSELFAKLDELLAQRHGKFPIIVCIDNFMIRPRVADDYGRVVREMIDRYATGVARYGEPSTVKQIIAVEAMKEGFRANLFESFDQAYRHLRDELSGSSLPRSVRGSVASMSIDRSVLPGKNYKSPVVTAANDAPAREESSVPTGPLNRFSIRQS